MAGTANPNLPTFLLNATTVIARAIEVPDADFAGGMNRGGSNAPGVGINTSDIDPKLDNWSLLDQFSAARNPQDSQHLGGDGTTVGSPTANSPINADQDPDFNDTLAFVVADTQAAPDVEFDTVSGAVNQTNFTIEIGDRAWGTIPVA